MKKILIIISFCVNCAHLFSSPPSLEIPNLNNKISFEILKKLGKEENIFFSPFSIYTAISMAYIGSKGETKKEFENILGINEQNIEELKKIFKTIVSQDEKTIIKIANKIWPAKTTKINEKYIKTVEKIFDTTVEQLDYSQKKESAYIINNWVSGETNQKIREIISPDILGPLVKLIITNAIYFNSEWDKKFEKEKTYEDYFYDYKNQKHKIKFMLKNEKIKFYRDNNISIGEIPYKNKKISMIIILPQNIEKIEIDYDKIKEYNLMMKELEVEIHFPKFKIEYLSEFAPVFNSMGIKKAFISGEADFTGIMNDSKLYIKYILHKAFIEVDERGTEAAAATAIIMNTKSAKIELEKIVFKVNKPFIFLILDNNTKTILFLGRIVKLEK